MKSASAKNGLGALLDEVRRGETVLITNHGKPVSRIESCHTTELTAGEAEAELDVVSSDARPADAARQEGFRVL